MLSGRASVASEATIAARLLDRNAVALAYFEAVAPALARAARDVAARFQRGGSLYAFGRGAYATDAAHVSVEFVHPVIVGKRALPALDVSQAPGPMVRALARAEDVAVAFGPPEGDPAMLAVLKEAQDAGALTLALPGTSADYAFEAPSPDAHVHQELFEVLGHTLYESVHVFLEHRNLGHDVGASGFLYPYLGGEHQDTESIVADVGRSILEKVKDGARLREQIAERQTGALARAIDGIAARVARGGRIVAFGNGGSATDANDLVFDCVEPPPGMAAIPAFSLAGETATFSAIANDVGVELAFMRQIIARCRPEDVAFALSTSGGSKNVVAALGEARRRGMLTVALLGYDGGEIARNGLADVAIVVDCDFIPRIQETQAAIYHVIRESLARDA
jgi:D-sedoheptulose 7-phosphate isomerase